MILSLDNDTPRHHLCFGLRDGRTLCSQAVNWREVELDAIDALTISIRSKAFTVSRSDYPGFVEFVHFRTDAIIHKYHDGAFIPEQVKEWVVGWTDGSREFCWIFDFATGDLKEQREYERNVALFESHFHPQSKSGGIILVGS